MSSSIALGSAIPDTTSVLTRAMIKKDDVEIMFQREDNLIEDIPEFKDMKI